MLSVVVGLPVEVAAWPWSDPAWSLIDKSKEARKAGHLEEAERYLREAVAANPRSPAAHSELGSMLDLRGDYAGALDQFDTLVALEPRKAFSYSNRAIVQLKLRRWKRAIEDCSTALRLQPVNPDALVTRAIALVEVEDWAKAVVDLTEALRQYADQAKPEAHGQVERAYLIRGAALAALGRVDEARHDLEIARAAGLVTREDEHRLLVEAEATQRRNQGAAAKPSGSRRND